MNQGVVTFTTLTSTCSRGLTLDKPLVKALLGIMLPCSAALAALHILYLQESVSGPHHLPLVAGLKPHSGEGHLPKGEFSVIHVDLVAEQAVPCYLLCLLNGLGQVTFDLDLHCNRVHCCHT